MKGQEPLNTDGGGPAAATGSPTLQTQPALGHLGARPGLGPSGDSPRPPKPSGGGSLRESVFSAAFFLNLFAF